MPCIYIESRKLYMLNSLDLALGDLEALVFSFGGILKKLLKDGSTFPRVRTRNRQNTNRTRKQNMYRRLSHQCGIRITDGYCNNICVKKQHKTKATVDLEEVSGKHIANFQSNLTLLILPSIHAFTISTLCKSFSQFNNRSSSFGIISFINTYPQ